MADNLVPLEVVCSPEPLATRLAGEGWGEVHQGVAEEKLLAGECFETDGARHWILVHLHLMFLQLVLCRKHL